MKTKTKKPRPRCSAREYVETRGRMAQAEREAADPQNVIWGLEPQTRKDDLASSTIWASACGRFQIVRRQSYYQALTGFVVLYRREIQQRTYQRGSHIATGTETHVLMDSILLTDDGRIKSWRTISRALEVFRAFFRDKFGRMQKTNEGELMTAATEANLADTPGEYQANSATKPVVDSPAEPRTPTKPRGFAKKEGARTIFGTSVGSNTEKVESALSAKPTSINDLIVRAGLGGVQYKGFAYNHLNRLANEGKILKTPDGYALKK